MSDIRSRIPSIYKSASLRVVTPIDAEYVGIGVNLEDGSVIRLKLPVSDVLEMAHLMACHSEGSAGIPSCDVSNTS